MSYEKAMKHSRNHRKEVFTKIGGLDYLSKWEEND